MRFSAFTSYGFLRYTSKPSVHESVYKSMRTALGGDSPSPKSYNFSVGGHVEASLFARSKTIGATLCITERAGNQSDPAETLEMMPWLEKDHRIIVPMTASIAERRAVLKARAMAGKGARRESVENQLRAVLGDDFVAYRPVNESEQHTWPLPQGASPGVYTRTDIAPKHFRVLYGNTILGSDWVGYEAIADDTEVMDIGDIASMNAGDLENAERVTVTDTRVSALGVLEFQATFSLYHTLDMLISTGPFPAQMSTRRFSFVVVSAAASVDPVKRAKVDEVMNRIARGVSSWAVVQESAPGVIGPYIIGVSPLGTTPFGPITI